MSCTRKIPPGLSRRITKLAQGAVTIFLVTMAVPVFLNASALNGNLSLSSAGANTVAVNGADIDFDFAGAVMNGFPPTATFGVGPGFYPADVNGAGDAGSFTVTSASTGSFATTSGVIGSTVTVADLPGGAVGGSLPNFLTFSFAGNPGWEIYPITLLPGTGGSACVSECTPPGSPFTLINEAADQVLVGFAFTGIATDGMGDLSAVAGTFSTTFSDTTLQVILADLAAGDAIVSSANATIAFTPIPEPGSISMLLIGCGLLATSVVYRRYQRR